MYKSLAAVILLLFCLHKKLLAQTSITNVMGRNSTTLNGKWKIIIDAFDAGSGTWAAYYKDRKPTGNKDFVESSFDLGPSLNVPGDFNSQMPELNHYESSVWYKKTFNYSKKNDTRLFIHFAAVNYRSEVYLNSVKLGQHEGGFTPFQFELTGLVKEGENTIIVKANNSRIKDGIPGLGFDWFNYGGITRDVNLIQTSQTFIEDYAVQLKKDKPGIIAGFIKLNGNKLSQHITLNIPELKITRQLATNNEGLVYFEFPVKPRFWSPEDPKLYNVKISCETDSIKENIGFRTIQVKGTDILLNGKNIFLKGINIHEEIPQQRSRAYSEGDALVLLNQAKELGCNFVRLVHYPHNEHTIKLAEKMGFMVWEEIPLYQGIDFADTTLRVKMHTMLREMIQRDRNRANIILWSLANETHPSKQRDEALTGMIHLARSLDSTRLITSAFDNVKYKQDTAIIHDTLSKLLDVISVNEYLGWYRTWPKDPGEMQWISAFNKPLIISEFGGEALYGNDDAKPDVASSWSEDYQKQIFIDQFKMFKSIPFLRGTCPWILADFRSPGRNHPKYQNGWNRKGLLSDRGEKKKAWYVVHDHYTNKQNAAINHTK